MKFEQGIQVGGEFKYTVLKEDGTIKMETDFQDNLVTENVFRWLLEQQPIDNTGATNTLPSQMFGPYLAVGEGTTPPTINDFALNSLCAITSANTGGLVVEPGLGSDHVGYVKFSRTSVFSFSNLNNKNITEIGLCHQYYGTTPDRYALQTRALVKDSNGTPIAITVLPGEILQVTYRTSLYASEAIKTGTFTVTSYDDTTTTKTFDYAQAINSEFSDSLWSSKHGPHLLAHPANEAPGTGTFDLNTEKSKITWGKSLMLFNTPINPTTSLLTGKDLLSYTAMWYENESVDFATKTRKVTVGTGPFCLVHPNGIRVLYFNPNGVPGTAFMFSEQNTKDGILKDAYHKWEIDMTITYSRWP